MCGIAGLLHVDPAQPADSEVVRRMTRTLVHRGPDGDGFHIEGNLGLGMQRLAILDPEGGNQPVYNEDRTVVVIHNGEIYNYVELRNELESLGHVFQSRGDTEVLVHAYEAWGDEMVQRLNGMWAFALWDKTRARLLLSRDRLGIKPLYYHWDGHTLYFGSEAKALRGAGITAEPNPEVLDAYLAFGFVPEPYSFFRGIQKLPAGHNLVCGQNTPSLRRYWEVPVVDESDSRRDEARIVEEFRSLFLDAVRLQMRSDVPFGAFLSGGLDSGSIVAIMSEWSREPVRTFTIGFDSPAYDERRLARLVAARFGTQHTERNVEPTDLEWGVEKLVEHFDEPFGDGSALATYLVAGLARERVAVSLTGDGGDEVLAGYTRYQGEKFSRMYAALPGFLRRSALPWSIDAARHFLPARWHESTERASRVLETANVDFEERLTRKQSWSSPELRKDLLRSEGPEIRPARDFVEEVLRRCPARDNFHRLNWFDLKMMLPSQMLTKVDRMTMAHSLEARVPFLDHRIVELMATVSARVQLPGFTRKNVLRRAVGSLLPPELLQAKKRGFNVPLREWFQPGAASTLLRHRVERGALEGLVKRDAFDRLIEGHKAEHGNLFWILLQLAVWREHLDTVVEPA